MECRVVCIPHIYQTYRVGLNVFYTCTVHAVVQYQYHQLGIDLHVSPNIVSVNSAISHYHNIMVLVKTDYNPVSHHTFAKLDGSAVVAEWLRRWTRNPLGSARTGSNPVGSVNFCLFPWQHGIYNI